MQTFRDEMRLIESKVREVLPDIAILLTISAKAIAERTIKDKGFGYSYSTNTVPAWFLQGKEWNGIGEKFIEKKIKDGEESNWKELRSAQGMQTAYVDLSYSNEMWNNMAPAPVTENNGVFSAPLAATNTAVQNKMNFNRDRYGDFIGNALTPEDYKILMQIVISEVLKAINSIGLTSN